MLESSMRRRMYQKIERHLKADLKAIRKVDLSVKCN